MLEYLLEFKTAHLIRTAINKTLTEGIMTADLGGRTTTSEFTNVVINNFKSL